MIKAQFDGISPTFFVTDLRAALAFYRDGLCFELGWMWGEPPTHANVCKGPVSLNLTLDPVRVGMGEAYVGMRDIDTYWADLRRRSVSCGDLADRAYGMRDFLVTDPNGNRLVFGEEIGN